MAQSVRADKGDSWGLGSGSAGLYLESALVDKLSTISRGWLTLGGQSLQGQQGPRYIKAPEYRKEKTWLAQHCVWSHMLSRRLPWWLSGKESTCQCRRRGFDPWVEKISRRRKMANHSCILGWEVPWTEEPGRLQSMGSQRVGHNLATKQQQQKYSKFK